MYRQCCKCRVLGVWWSVSWTQVQCWMAVNDGHSWPATFDSRMQCIRTFLIEAQQTRCGIVSVKSSSSRILLALFFVGSSWWLSSIKSSISICFKHTQTHPLSLHIDMAYCRRTNHQLG
ncbi:hypothetical protein BJ875DRAFT_55182 [Amylocarpus encephaloides]|uniref:Secreted protein n=1 Tax=Amylocarpus encephaloides TaxID=45428 RepID=A0A9P8C4F5_9HELO|nr:hypothetical protein BJ875DRAFT_55182 [Amylocarpus encephaloides]